MRFDFNVYSSLLLIFFVHGFVYAYLLYKKSLKFDSKAEKWLAAFLALCIVYISPWMLGFAGWYDNQPYRDILFYVPSQQMLIIGPVVFFYIQSLLNPSFKFQRKHYWHFLPGILYILFTLVMFITDKLILHEYYFLASGADPDFDFWYQATGFASMLFYFFLSYRFYRIYRKMIVQVVSYADLLLFRWIRNFLVAFLLMLLAQVLHTILFSIFPVMNNYIGSWWYFFCFSIIFYYIAITGYSNNAQTKVYFKVNDLLMQRPVFLLNNAAVAEKETNDSTEEAAYELIESREVSVDFEPGFPLSHWKEKIEKLFLSERIYENAELSLTDLARKLNLAPSLLSKIINKGFGMNLNDFVNGFRVQAVIEKLRSGEQKSQTLLGIAFDAGFNSKATFNRSFKKITGMSPKDWMEKNL